MRELDGHWLTPLGMRALTTTLVLHTPPTGIGELINSIRLIMMHFPLISGLEWDQLRDAAARTSPEFVPWIDVGFAAYVAHDCGSPGCLIEQHKRGVRHSRAEWESMSSTVGIVVEEVPDAEVAES